MTVKTAKRHNEAGAEEVVFFTDLAGELGGKGTLLVFHITELLDPERGDYSWHGPLTGDALIVDSDEKPDLNGKIVRDLNVKFAPTWPLRGQPKPGDDVRRARDIPDGENEVGDDIVARIRLKKGKSPNGFIAVDEPTSSEWKEALKAIKAAGGDDWATSGGLNDGGNTGGNKRNGDTVLDRSQARQAQAAAAKPVDDELPPF